jgi:hypothetical protein
MEVVCKGAGQQPVDKDCDKDCENELQQECSYANICCHTVWQSTRAVVTALLVTQAFPIVQYFMHTKLWGSASAPLHFL